MPTIKKYNPFEEYGELWNDIVDWSKDPLVQPQNQNRYYFSDAKSYYEFLCQVLKLLKEFEKAFSDIYDNQDALNEEQAYLREHMVLDSDLTTAINTLRNQIQTQINQIKSRLDDAEDTLEIAVSDIESLQTDVTTIQSSINTINTAIQGINTTLTSHATRLTTAEEDINHLFEDVEEIDLGKEDSSNKVTSISSSSTNIQYPSAKAVYDYIQSLNGNSIAY